MRTDTTIVMSSVSDTWRNHNKPLRVIPEKINDRQTNVEMFTAQIEALQASAGLRVPAEVPVGFGN